MSRLACLLFIAVLWPAACTTSSPAQTVEAYLQAIVDDQPEKLADLTCEDWEANALTTASSFRGTGAQLEDMTCVATGADGDYQIVTCQGRIVVLYQGEERTFELGSYRLLQQDQQWRVCGEA